jgi:hypothetical protein
MCERGGRDEIHERKVHLINECTKNREKGVMEVRERVS